MTTVSDMIGRARYQKFFTLLIGIDGLKKKVRKHSSSLWGFLLRKLTEHHLVLFTKAGSLQWYTKFTILFHIMKCAFIEQNNYQKYLRTRIVYEKIKIPSPNH